MNGHWAKAMRQARRIGKSKRKALSVRCWANQVKRACIAH